jgi:hypothetical protein
MSYIHLRDRIQRRAPRLKNVAEAARSTTAIAKQQRGRLSALSLFDRQRGRA